MQSMKGATSLLGSMNRQMNLPALQRIAMEFEKENDIMDQRQEMMDDAIDDVTGLEDEEEGEDVVREVLDEIGVDLGQAVRICSAVCPRYRYAFTQSEKTLANPYETVGRNSFGPSEKYCSRRPCGTSYWWRGRQPGRRRSPSQAG